MLKSVARAVQALALWCHVESNSAEKLQVPESVRKSHMAAAHRNFIAAAYEVASSLVPLLLDFGEVVTKNNIHYTAVAGGGGFVVLKPGIDTDHPGIFMTPEGVTVPSAVPIPPPSIENWLQLMGDLPDLLEILEVK